MKLTHVHEDDRVFGKEHAVDPLIVDHLVRKPKRPNRTETMALQGK
jgi:hypothetical protein